ncbi:1,2-phenylacetyl-CoA epoxidase, subunit E [Variibacter gotjawalensis]|uniref:1,2-phenylacetyl-CoA epoxidase, subunit E n=1 Tax=Variibacter gotjawalensis TaxID=1333996 RepID=A0A0S3PNJ1_9BRAD|nr:1,2-phenylacetyl-CoA epoxidase subunit PaaE [Variibacter gotjawalensis]NIK47783.1 ring-1,2-phenylacetyl-CoA epoxidase subunit PaaE [Variibacter gotjawalensis]RZS49670.1 ring-1,2-phenylacetyl-CoA epoxidase subunit PaaE [Variibacter gotjawalensis]BAT57499.1 1,2-phenylacetyl-CoA epoxidase, subunit E [Variibacter gotjawalensis]
MAIAFHKLTVSDVRRETPDAVSIAFAVPPDLADDYRFVPGQHLTLRRDVSGEDQRRSYSICTAEDEGELRIAVKQVDGGVFSTFANSTIKVGDTLDVMTPQGRFGVPHDAMAARTYLAVAAGSGITPVMSMMKTVLRNEPMSRFILIYGNRTAQTIIFKDALDDLKDKYLGRLVVHHVLSREPQEVPMLSGRIDGEKLSALVRASGPVAGIDHAFLCGPGALITESKAALEQLGLPTERIHIEYFSTDGMPVERRVVASQASDEVASATAAIMLDGAYQEVPMRAGESVMDAGIRAGLEMPYSCKGGMCCTCRAKVTEGEVEMDLNYSLEPWELEAGFVLTCQAHPKTSRIAVDFDAV